MMGSSAIAQPDPTPTTNSLGEVVDRSLEDPSATTEPLAELPPATLDQLIADIKEMNLARDRVLWKFQTAKWEWQDLTSQDLVNFINGVCRGFPVTAASILLERLPGVQQAHASLLAEAVGLIRCASPQALDRASNTLLTAAMTNTIKADSSASTQAPASATKEVSAELNGTFKVACATGTGTLVAKLINSYEARSFKFVDLFTAGATALGAYVSTECTNALSSVVANLQSQSGNRSA
jgi:hypothetical protein